MPASSVPSSYGQHGNHPSCFDRVKVGFVMGGLVGLASGVLLGGAGAWQQGLRGRAMLRLLGKTMLQAGATFGTFMGVGSALRC